VRNIAKGISEQHLKDIFHDIVVKAVAGINLEKLTLDPKYLDKPIWGWWLR